MALREVCMYKGTYIGIESVFTVIDGKQINIPGKIEELRAKGRNNELFCPCGCGANLLLVAGENNLREQHFRLKDGANSENCCVVAEGKTSIDSKVVLKCWLDDKLAAGDLESRVPICEIGDTNRKYEFSFLSLSKKVALSYCYDRVNLSDEKFCILQDNSKNIRVIYVVDSRNDFDNLQYPERLIKIQNRQGYCLLLSVDSMDYSDAYMKAVYYRQDVDGLWREIEIAKGFLERFNINGFGDILFDGAYLKDLLNEKLIMFNESMETVLATREQQRIEYQKREEEDKEQQEKQREAIKAREKLMEEQRKRKELGEIGYQKAVSKYDEDFAKKLETTFDSYDGKIIDDNNKRWFKCEYCGKYLKEDEIVRYKGNSKFGKCKECVNKRSTV